MRSRFPNTANRVSWFIWKESIIYSKESIHFTVPWQKKPKGIDSRFLGVVIDPALVCAAAVCLSQTRLVACDCTAATSSSITQSSGSFNSQFWSSCPHWLQIKLQSGIFHFHNHDVGFDKESQDVGGQIKPNLRGIVQTCKKIRRLGCVNPAFSFPLAVGGEFTQPSLRLFMHVTCLCM